MRIGEEQGVLMDSLQPVLTTFEKKHIQYQTSAEHIPIPCVVNHVCSVFIIKLEVRAVPINPPVSK